MVDVDDPTGINRKLERRWEQLDESDIDDRDRDAIASFVEYRRGVEERSRNTRTRDLSTLRCASERAATPLVDMALGDARRLLTTLAKPADDGGYGLDPDGAGMFGYKRAMRIFFRWLDEQDGHGTYGWHDDITLPDLEIKGAGDRDEMLTAEEVEQLKDATRNPRDRALIDLLADVGGRITMVLSLRRSDLHLDGDEPYFTPRGDLPDGLKDLDSDEIPVLYSRAELRSWTNVHHPDTANPDAPLWARVRGYNYDDPQTQAIGYDRARGTIQVAARRADIDKPVNPHSFRRLSATRMSNSDRLVPQEIVQVMGWADDRPLEFYDLTTERERNANIHQSLGFSDADGDDGGLEWAVTICGTCREQLSADARFCPNCGGPTTEATRDEVVRREEGVAEDGLHTDDAEKRILKANIRGAIKDDPSTVDGAIED